MMKWSGCQRWWEVSNDKKSLVKTAEELCKIILKRDEDKKRERLFLDWERNTEEQDEGKGEAEALGSRLGQPNEDSDLGRLKSDCELHEWTMKDQLSKAQNDGAKDAEHAGQD